MDADPAGNKIILTYVSYYFHIDECFFAGAEMAVVSVNHNRIRSLAAEGNKKQSLSKVFSKIPRSFFQRFR